METEELQKLREAIEENNKLLREIRNWIKYTVKDQLDHISAVYATLERMYSETRRKS